VRNRDSARADAVVCADNALPHLLAHSDVVAALRQMNRVLRPGGTVIVSIRDYDRILTDPPASTLPQVFASGGARVISFQLWDWRGEKDIYDLEHFQVHEQADGTRPMDDERRADITTASSCVEVADGEPSQVVIARRESDHRDAVTALIAAAVASVRARQPETIGS
jgi:SAM-dependent methyltransferase